ncbi:class I SAM-dependent methyltransferase [Oceanomicrobium pacificus]|uniref:Methyltransferase domain-containing protein n=1 Tax=Oceanomicrobium pacificus TaxID=2692916 RepID=A0A6B0TIX5_9RHOB|nr:methyltransferase domain-containing protein [Oceanomicrobium pacificus]MXU63816.1 methyltransferase domain-containing protein [Oceanomicrobium pacificus]
MVEQKSQHRSRLPVLIEEPLKHCLAPLRVWKRTASIGERQCPICGFVGGFKEFGHPPRYDSRCPGCQSLERHRLLALAVEQGLIPFFGNVSDLSMLHFAPDAVMADYFDTRFGRHVTADLFMEGVDHAFDIENIDAPDCSYDVVLASHVLEHVDDFKASAEIRRILVDGGLFLAMVPIAEGWSNTYENPAIDGAQAREMHFGQSDHVRYYGADFSSRIERSGLRLVKEITATGQECADHGLIRGEKVFVFAKS